jgi:hypothetical protein
LLKTIYCLQRLICAPLIVINFWYFFLIFVLQIQLFNTKCSWMIRKTERKKALKIHWKSLKREKNNLFSERINIFASAAKQTCFIVGHHATVALPPLWFSQILLFSRFGYKLFFQFSEWILYQAIETLGIVWSHSHKPKVFYLMKSSSSSVLTWVSNSEGQIIHN